jgi:hypothetical protein
MDRPKLAAHLVCDPKTFALSVRTSPDPPRRARTNPPDKDWVEWLFPLVECLELTFAEIERLVDDVERRAASYPQPHTPERDEYFRVLHDERGRSYALIADRDEQARAAGLSRDAVIGAVRRARSRKKI